MVMKPSSSNCGKDSVSRSTPASTYVVLRVFNVRQKKGAADQ